MGSKSFVITMPEWVTKDILGNTNNRSGRIQELVIKGYMAEKLQLQQDLNTKSQLSKDNAPNVYIGLFDISSDIFQSSYGVVDALS